MSNLSKKTKKKLGKAKKPFKQASGRAMLTAPSSHDTVNAVAKLATKVMATGGSFGGFKAKKGKLRDRLNAWLESLANPFVSEPVKCPVNFNPMPTLQSTVLRTTSTLKLVCVPGTTIQVCLFPGHTTLVDADEMDGPSYHQNWQIVGGSNYYPVGPITYPDGASVNRAPIPGVVSYIAAAQGGGSLAGVAVDTSQTTPIQNSPISYDTVPPFIGSAKNGYHTRYKMTAMGVRFRNESVTVNSGGEFYTVQPLNTVALSTVNAYSLYPTFRNHGVCSTNEGNVSWIPRIQDLSFYHPGAQNVSATNSIAAAGILLWFINTTNIQQNLSFEMVYDWEVGGQYMQTLSTPAAQMPSDQNVVAPTLSALQQTAHTATPAPRVAEVVAAAQSPFRDFVSDSAKAAGKLVAEHASDMIKSHIGGKLGIQLAGHLAGLF